MRTARLFMYPVRGGLHLGGLHPGGYAYGGGGGGWKVTNRKELVFMIYLSYRLLTLVMSSQTQNKKVWQYYNLICFDHYDKQIVRCLTVLPSLSLQCPCHFSWTTAYASVSNFKVLPFHFRNFFSKRPHNSLIIFPLKWHAMCALFLYTIVAGWKKTVTEKRSLGIYLCTGILLINFRLSLPRWIE